MRYICRPKNPPIQAVLDKLAKTPGADWETFGKDHADEKKELLKTLWAMQKQQCAYCECRLPDVSAPEVSKKMHIEHFRPKGSNPKMTFDWENLFLSCSSNSSCGVWKDGNSTARGIDINAVFKPDTDENLAAYFVYEDGEIQPARNLEPQLEKTARLTIQKFNLNASNLVNRRRNVERCFRLMFTDQDSSLLDPSIDVGLIRESLSGEGYSSLVDYLIRVTKR